jgi:hypothetical protein
MPQEIKVGSILVREGILFPPGVAVESEALFFGWKLIRNLDGYALGRIISKADWNFFYLAGEIRAIAFGRKGSASRSALKQILAKREGQNYNSLEITKITTKWFFGIPFLSIAANSRHIQKGLGLIPARKSVSAIPAPDPSKNATAQRYKAMISSS